MKHCFLLVVFLKVALVHCQVATNREIKSSVKNQTNASPQSQHDVNFNSLWSTESPSFQRPGNTPSGRYYYQVVLITVHTTGIYTTTSQSSADTFGYLYSPSFDRRSPNQDLIGSDDDSGGNRQFQFIRNLAVNRRYYLVITTYSPSVTGTFTVTISGPKEVDVIPITGPFSFSRILTSKLDFTNRSFRRPHGYSDAYLYSVIQIIVQVTGDYTFQSTSSFDTVGLLYYPKFNRTLPSSNLVADDGGSEPPGQFYITHRLIADRRYFLVLTSFYTDIIGTLRMNVTGPGPFDLVEVQDQTMTVNSTLSSRLNRTHPKFSRPYGLSSDYYYKLFQLVPSDSGYYRFRVNGHINPVVYLHQNNFSPLDPWSTWINSGDYTAGSQAYSFFEYLQTGTTYYMVVSTSEEKITGNFTVRVTGYATLRIINLPTSLSATTKRSSSLTTSSPRFTRPGTSERFFYYRNFRLAVPTTGLYSLFTTGSVDTFGLIYRSSFNATSPDQNLIASDDQSGGRNQFRLAVVLHRNVNYFLVVTTFRPKTFGSFAVTVNGPAAANLTVPTAG